MDQLFRRLAAFTLVGLLVAPGVALADGARRHYGDHDWRNYRYSGHYQPYKRHYDPYRFKHHHWAGRGYGAPKHGYPRHGYRRHGHVYSLVPPWPGYGCRPVVIIDRYRGAKARGSGSLCFDALGRAFIVHGSPYSSGYRY